MPKPKKSPTKADKAASVAARHSDLMLEGITGVLEVRSGADFNVEVWLVHDNPKWSVALGGLTADGDPFERSIGKDQPYMLKKVGGVPDGNYALTIVATLQDPGAQFTLVADSGSDRERIDLRPLPGTPTRMTMLPVRVG